MIRSRSFRSRAAVSGSIPTPGCETSPSTTSIFSASKAPNRSPYLSNNGSNTGDPSIIFSKRCCAGLDFCRRISKYSFPISGRIGAPNGPGFGPLGQRSINVFASHTLPMNPVTPISITRFPPSAFRTENGAGCRFSVKYTIGRTRGASTRTAGTIAEASAFGPRKPRARTHRAGLCCPSGPASRIRANNPRGRIT